MNMLKFDKCYKGLKVQDTDGSKGTITEVDDIHNISVEFDGGSGLYCLDSNCSEYEPLFEAS